MTGTYRSARRILYVCGIVGVPDIDRCNALIRAGHNVSVYELDRTTEYIWDKAVGTEFNIIQMHGASLKKLVSDIIQADLLIVYGYNKPAAIAISNICAALGRKAISIHDSKFNDYKRSVFGDFLKSFLLRPYNSFFAASSESRDYLIYLGADKDIHLYYCAIDIDRIVNNSTPSVERLYQERDFLMIGRFVPKKNYHTALSSYERYRQMGGTRNFTICGYGEMEGELRQRVSQSSTMRDTVSFISAATTKQVGIALSNAVALILPSIEEQFGIVVTEAMAAGVPVIASQVCGACDLFANGKGGFKVEPYNIDGIAMFMQKLGGDEQFWRSQSDICRMNARKADISVFTGAVEAVIVD